MLLLNASHLKNIYIGLFLHDVPSHGFTKHEGLIGTQAFLWHSLISYGCVCLTKIFFEKESYYTFSHYNPQFVAKIFLRRIHILYSFSLTHYTAKVSLWNMKPKFYTGHDVIMSTA